MNWLFTGFGPFDGAVYNPSWDAAQAAAEASGATAELLPVTFDEALAIAQRAADYDLVVHFGVAVRRNDVCLERFAHNWGAERKDTAPTRLLPDGPVALECALPLDALAAALDGECGRKWRVSHDAGMYVCNATLYHSLNAALPAMFVHIPPSWPDDARAIGRCLAGALPGWL